MDNMVHTVILDFATPYNMPGQRKRNEDPLYILQKRFVTGLINTEEYNDKKGLLEKDIAKLNGI